MKIMGFHVSKCVKDRTLEYFEKNGMDGDALKLKQLFDNDTVERLCRIVKNNAWSDDVEKQIRDLNVGFSSELIKLVLENLGSEPNKAMVFFRWVEESGVFKHDVFTYNAIARVLERECSIDRYLEFFPEDDGVMLEQEMEEETFVKVLQNDKNPMFGVKKQKENETASVERIHIKEAEMKISKLKQLLEEKEQCILQHKEQEKKLKRRILYDHYMKQAKSTLLTRLVKKIFNMSENFEAAIEGLKSEVQNKCHKQEEHFAESEEGCRKILADCGEESSRQQLMMHIQQGHSDQLKRLRESTNAVWKDFDGVNEARKLFLYEDDGVMLELEQEM